MVCWAQGKAWNDLYKEIWWSKNLLESICLANMRPRAVNNTKVPKQEPCLGGTELKPRKQRERDLEWSWRALPQSVLEVGKCRRLSHPSRAWNLQGGGGAEHVFLNDQVISLESKDVALPWQRRTFMEVIAAAVDITPRSRWDQFLRSRVGTVEAGEEHAFEFVFLIYFGKQDGSLQAAQTSGGSCTFGHGGGFKRERLDFSTLLKPEIIDFCLSFSYYQSITNP